MPEADHLQSVLQRLQQTARQGRSRSLDWRQQQLEQLQCLLRTHGNEIAAALTADLGKSAFEAHLTETGYLLAEIAQALKCLRRWARPRRVRVPLRLFPARAEVRPRPYGTVLILSPWNYPIELALAPVVSALAAGNCVILKPSEAAPASSALLARLIPAYLDPDGVAVITGPPETAAALSALPVDYIFFTGSARVGRQVMAAAATHLTPVTLELGGKSPCIVDATADIPVAARRIVWGKCLNAGQTCVAPDYLLVEQSIVKLLIAACVDALQDFFGPDPRRSEDYSRIVNHTHYARLEALLQDGTIIHGGRCDPAERYIEPTLLGDVSPDSAVMQEEIFGPILPILPYTELAHAIDFVARRPAPLALYVFSDSKTVHRQVLEQVCCGGACINDVILHLTVHDLPFGGVGESGMGAYHGRAGFETFCHQQSVLTRGTRPDPRLRYPPYSALARRILGSPKDVSTTA